MDDDLGAPDPAGTAAPHSPAPGWIRIVALVLLIAAAGFVVVRFVKREVVTNWTVLASCQTIKDIGADRVSTVVDTTACLTPPTVSETKTGWQIVTFVLPSDVGSDPRVTAITSDPATGEMSIAYDSPPRSKSNDTGGHTLVFVEVPPGEVPPTPFTIQDSAGATTVTSAPSAEPAG